ncbi:hypothetical protein ACFL6W_09770 [Thermodesulfobacteriota bacterium]
MAKHNKDFFIPVKERNKPLVKGRGKDYFCTVVSENVEITLKNKLSLSIQSNKELYVQCNQYDCQYVDINRPPCPLSLDLFSDEVEKREEKYRDSRM